MMNGAESVMSVNELCMAGQKAANSELHQLEQQLMLVSSNHEQPSPVQELYSSCTGHGPHLVGISSSGQRWIVAIPDPVSALFQYV